MSTNNTQCPEIIMSGNCTKGEDCPYCKANLEMNFNVNAKVYVPKSKRQTSDTVEGTTNQISNVSEPNTNGEKLNFNLGANEYVPKMMPKEEGVDQNEELEDDEELEEEEFDQIMKDIINDEVMEEIEDEDESDDEKWFPKFKDCECCKGFIYKCNGVACVNMGTCYCKMKEECDDEEL